jgi:hypothetical protein
MWMFEFLTNGRLAYIRILKNASSSWAYALTQQGWLTYNLYKTLHHSRLDPDRLIWFGMLRDPMMRHSMGIVQYLVEHSLEACLDDQLCHPLLVSGCLDAHSMPITSQIPERIVQRCHWFVMDHPTYDYKQLCQGWLRSHGVDLPKVPRLNSSNHDKRELLTRVEELKQKYPAAHDRLQMTLGQDLHVYRSHIQRQHEYLVAGEGFEPPSSGL